MYKIDYSAIKRNGVLIYTTWMTIMFSKKKKKKFKPDTMTHTLHDSSYRKYTEQANLEGQIPGQ